MLFQHLLVPGSGVDIEQMVCTLPEAIEPESLRAAWQRVVDRHAVLRTGFRWEGLETPQQEVWREVAVPFALEDWSDLSEGEQKNRRAKFLTSDRLRGFAMHEPPLMRVTLLRTARARHELIWTFHHAMLDGRSFPHVLREAFAFYEAIVENRDCELPLPRPYRDYIDWLARCDANTSEKFWRELLTDFTAPTPLTVDHRATTHTESRQGQRELFLSTPATTALESLARAHELTLNTLLQGAWAILLSRYNGEADVVFGATRACRKSTIEGAESMVGLFINTLPVRVRVPPDAPLLPWLRELRAQWIAMRPHEHTPLVKVRGWSEIPSDRPLFESILVFENSQLEVTLRAQGGAWSRRQFQLHEQSGFPITVAAYAGPQLGLKIDFDRTRFDEATIDRMLGHLHTLLAGFIASPGARLSELPLLTEAERRQLLLEWNDTAVSFAPEATLAELFAAQARRTPTAVAVEFEGQTLTYQALDERANRLAQFLRRDGVRANVMVGICVDRSLELVIAIFGVLKAGGAYLPLDSSYPRQRLAFMLADAGVRTVLTQDHLVDFLPSSSGRTIRLDSDWPAIAPEINQCPDQPAQPEDAAYVIYTSGSTGNPKGVVIPHRAICNHMFWMQREFPLTAEDRVLQKTPTSFDASVWEFYAPLFVGARLVMAQPGGHRESRYLVRTVIEQGITTLQLVPSMLQLMSEEKDFSKCGSVKRLFCGGEALSVALKENVLRQLAVELINLYGPTEAAIDATFQRCDSRQRRPTVPIGRPVANTQLYVLDAWLQPVPIGVAGELYIGGHGLAHGYLNRPDLTADRFVVDPFSSRAGARLYKTGDLVRWLEDGTVEFLRRIDRQVKIRGFRVELGEIETAIASHPGVRECVVLLREDAPGNARLVAYFVPRPEGAPTVAELRAFLQTKLPEQFVPGALVPLAAWPLTPNGKIDRPALPAPDASLAQADTFVAPRSPIEATIAGIWAEMLKVEKVGVFDNFFDAGGHSLLATRVISRLRDAFSVELTLRHFLEAATVAASAELIEEMLAGPSASNGDHFIPRRATTGPIPLSFAQQRLWFLDQLEPNSPFYNIWKAARLGGTLNVSALQRALAAIATRHESLRTTFPAVGGEPLQVIAEQAPDALQIIDLETQPAATREAEAQRLLHAEVSRPFNLARGPMFRSLLLRLGPQEHLLLLTIHHIVSDGWSMGILFRELTQLYVSFCTGQPSPLPELPVQYGDYAVWQRDFLQGEILDKQLAYWKTKLAGLAVLEMPTDYARPPQQTFRGQSRPVRIAPAVAAELQTVMRQERVTLFMLLLAAFQTLLHRYSGQDDIVVGSPLAGRTRSEVEGLIGFFITTLALRTDASGDPSFREFLRRVRDVCLEADAHQDLPFEKLVEELQPQRDPSRSPLFQIVFQVQNVPRESLDLAGLKLQPVGLKSEIAKFDLSLAFAEEPGGLLGDLTYNTDLFASGTIERLAGHLQTLVAGIAASPEARLSALPLLTEEERRQLVVAWNEPGVHYAPGTTLPEWFAAQAARTPEAVALAYEEQRLTYRALNERANQLAHHLRGLGVGPDVLVGLCVERSLELVVGVLGILKAGGAYVPLDPAYPAERLAFMLEDSRAPVVLTQSRLRADLPASAAHIVCLDGAEKAALAAQPTTDPPGGGSAANLAYVIYTSGSTGKPKGALVTQHNVVRLMQATEGWFHFNASDVWTLFHSYAFDFSVWEMWGALLYGGRLVIVPYLTSRSPEAFYELLRREGVTVLNQTPSAFRQLIQAEPAAARPQPLALRYVIFGGEALEMPSLQPWFERHGDERPQLVNMYGITETTVHVTYRPLTRHDVAGGSVIGIPLPDLQLYVLDPHLQPVPLGVPGELFVGGAGLARGYLNRPELTNERFLENPLGSQKGAKLYRTGDRARFLAGRDLEYLGRIDHQVKLRGFRIELGEIEAVLGQHPGVRAAVVLLREDTPGDKRLVAYLVADAPPPASNDLRRHLRLHVPEYMVPAAFVLLAALPLTNNGKIDRPALPAPAAALAAGSGFLAPRNALESELKNIWEDVLGVKPIGIRENFFDLGGHSLLAVKLFAKIEQVTGKKLPLATLFQAPTIEQCAEMLRRENWTPAWNSLVAIQPAGNKPPLFLVHAVGGNILNYQPLARLLAPDQPVYALQSVGMDGQQSPLKSVEEMAAAYIKEMRALQPRGPYHVGGMSFGGMVSWEIAQQLTAQGELIGLLALLDVAPWGALERLGRVEVFRLNALSLFYRIRYNLITFVSLPWKEKLVYIRKKKKTLKRRLKSRQWQREYMQMLRDGHTLPPGIQNVKEANFLAADQYEPQPYPGDVTVFRASEKMFNLGIDPRIGWRHLARKGVTIYAVPGDHLTLVEEPNVRTLVEKLRSCLAAPERVEHPPS